MKELFNRIDSLNDGTWQSLVLFYAVKIAIAVLMLLIGFWIINRVVKFFNRIFNRKRLDHTVTTFFKTLINAGLKIILVLFVLSFIGIQTTSIVALVGAAGLAIGLALQGTLTNLAGGVMLLIFKPFREGDYVEAQGKKGKVTDIQIFSTILIDDKNSKIIIPNSVLSNGIIQNHGKELPKKKKPETEEPTEPVKKEP